jgi:tetratricopeptide (TPR) repeat protein
VLQRDSANITATKGIAYLQMQLKHFPEAKEGYKKAVALDPTDPETFYSVGVVDWSMVYRDVTEEKSKLKLSSQDTLMGSPTCSDLRVKELANIEDGMAMLKQAITLRPDYDDAMAYMNLLYRLRADLDCHDKAAHEADIKTANNWSDSAMAARKKKAEAEKKRTHDGQQLMIFAKAIFTENIFTEKSFAKTIFAKRSSLRRSWLRRLSLRGTPGKPGYCPDHAGPGHQPGEVSNLNGVRQDTEAGKDTHPVVLCFVGCGADCDQGQLKT